MKQIDADFNVSFTTESIGKIKSAYVMKQELTEIFSKALYEYLDKHDVEINEVHTIHSDEVFIDTLEED